MQEDGSRLRRKMEPIDISGDIHRHHNLASIEKKTIINGDDISNKFELEELDLGLDITPGSLFQLRLVGKAPSSQLPTSEHHMVSESKKDGELGPPLIDSDGVTRLHLVALQPVAVLLIFALFAPNPAPGDCES